MYIEPTLYDFFESIKNKYDITDNYDNVFNTNKNLKIYSIKNYFLTHNDKDNYNFKDENSE
jgi:hypothetical protein